MNIEEIENQLSQHPSNMNKMLSAILETIIGNKAMLLTVLHNQAKILKATNSEYLLKDIEEIETSIIEIANNLKTEELIKIIGQVSR